MDTVYILDNISLHVGLLFSPSHQLRVFFAGEISAGVPLQTEAGDDAVLLFHSQQQRVNEKFLPCETVTRLLQ